MFINCYSLSADITNIFDNIVYSFEDNTQLIDKINIGNMFSGCTNIVGTANKHLLCTMKDIQINAFAECSGLANWQFIPKRFGGEFEKDIYPEDTVFRVNVSNTNNNYIDVNIDDDLNIDVIVKNSYIDVNFKDGITLINNSQQQITIDWGDGIISSYTSGTIQHNYSDLKEQTQFLVIVKNATNLILSGNASIIQIIQLGSNLETYQNMFTNCLELTGLFMPYIQLKSGLNMDNMFNGCFKLSVDISTLFDKDFYALSMNNTFNDCSNLFGLLYPIWQSTQYYSHQNTFTGCTKLLQQNKFIPFSWFNRTVNTYENNIPENINDDQTVFSIHLDTSTDITLNNICLQTIAVPSGYCQEIGHIQKSKTIYLESSGYIDWGDGRTSNTSLSSITHSYVLSGDYIIRLSGITQFTFNNNEYLTNVFAINKYIQNLDNTFENCINLQTVPSGLFDYPWCKSAKNLFKNCYSIRGISNIDYQHGNQLEFIDSAFENCQNLSDASSLYKLPNSVISINNLFKNTKINTLNENFVLNERLIQTSKAFNNCIELSSNNILSYVISKFNVDSSYMFKNCFGLSLNLTDKFTDLTTYVYRPVYVNVTEMFKNCFNIDGTISAAKLWNNDLNMFIPYNCFENCSGINNIDNIPIIWGGTAEWYLDQKISVFELTIPQPDGTPYRMTQEFNNVKSATNDYVYINWDWDYTSGTAILPSADNIPPGSNWIKYICSAEISEIVPIDNGYTPTGSISNSGIFLTEMTDQLSGLCNKIMPNNINWADTKSQNVSNNYYPYKYLTRVYYDAGKTISHTYTKAGKYTILVYNASTFGTKLGKTKVTDVIQLSNQLTRYTDVLRGSVIKDLSKSRITLPSAITDTAYMFAQCQHLTKLPKQFKLYSNSNISTMQGMFAQCSNLSLDIAEFFNDFDSRERAKTNINTFNFIKFNRPVVQSNWPNMAAAFAYCKSIYGTVPFDKLCYSNNDVVLAAAMFKDCINLNNYNLIPKNWGGPFISNNSLVLKVNNNFQFNILKYLSDQSLNKGLCKYYTINGSNKISETILTNTNISQNHILSTGISNEQYYVIFENCLPDLGTLNKSKIIQLIQFPKHCQAISNYFEDCTNLSSISEAVVLAGYSYPSMFAGCTSLKTIPESFVLSPYITDANGMFAGCSNLTTVNMKKLFENINKIDINKIDISNIFNGCNSLTGVVPIQLLESKQNISADNAFLNCSGLLNYNDIPSDWR